VTAGERFGRIGGWSARHARLLLVVTAVVAAAAAVGAAAAGTPTAAIFDLLAVPQARQRIAHHLVAIGQTALHDEVASARIINEPTFPGMLAHVARTESTPPLYYLLAWGWDQAVRHRGVGPALTLGVALASRRSRSST